MAHKIQIKRGNKADIPVLNDGEMGLCIDTQEVFVGSNGTNIPVSTKKRTARFVVGTSTAGWTAADCDYLCDGTADQTEINAAITALPAAGGEIVILDGTYNITAKIDVTKNNVSIIGNGNATILKRMFDSTSAEGVIMLINKNNCKIANLQIEGNKTSYDHNNNYGIYLYGSSNNTVTGNTCNNSYYRGIYLRDSSDNIVTGNTCNNNNSNGIYLDYSSNNNTVTGNTCNNNNSNGINLSSSSNENTITGNTCNNNKNGISLYASSNENTITGNTCNNNNSNGISLNASSNNTVTGNTCNNNNSNGIFLGGSSNNTITGNTCIRGTGLSTDYTASQYTIRIYKTGNSYNLISNNNCMGKAVVVDGGTGNSVHNNKWSETDDFNDLKNEVSEHLAEFNILQTVVDDKVNKVTGKQLSTEDYTTAEKTKLSGIASGANKIHVGTTAPTDTVFWLDTSV